MAEYIDRQAVIDLVDKGFLVSNANYGSVSRIVRQIPAADVAPVRHGRWKGEHKCGSFSHPDSITYECSECGYSVYTIYGHPPITNYCPNCGAKLDGGGDV